MKTLYLSDLDGTLLNREDRLSEFTVNTINRLVGEGMCFSYATARSLSSAAIVTEKLAVNIPVIVYNGAFIRYAKSGDILFSCGFTEEEKREVSLLLQKHNLYPMVYSFVNGVERVSWHQGKENDGMNRYLSLRKGDSRLRPITSVDRLYEGDVFYFTCIGKERELTPVYCALKDRKGYSCVFQQELYRPEYWCEIMPAQATKANAALKMKKILQCEAIVSFGDAVNDMPLFHASDECYAVENAVETLKSIATGVISSNREDGVAHWLEDHYQTGNI